MGRIGNLMASARSSIHGNGGALLMASRMRVLQLVNTHRFAIANIMEKAGVLKNNTSVGLCVVKVYSGGA